MAAVMRAYESVCAGLSARPRTWLVTGAAGFIGSNLVERLLQLDQRVIGLDSFATGHRANLDDVRATVAAPQWARFNFIEADVRDAQACSKACKGVDFVLHQAALGSIPRSLAQPLATHETNVTGFINVLLAARDAGVARVVYASSSSVYGDHPDAIRREEVLGRPLSPYAASKRAGELYAGAFSSSFRLPAVGLRYFNVFGPRQDPAGSYAAVIPRWADALRRGEPVVINGDGETSRDFCHVDNVVQANLLAATASECPDVLNIGTGVQTTLNQLFLSLRAAASAGISSPLDVLPRHEAFREGDVRHSVANISRAQRVVGYAPAVSVHDGLAGVVGWLARRGSIADSEASGV